MCKLDPGRSVTAAAIGLAACLALIPSTLRQAVQPLQMLVI